MKKQQKYKLVPPDGGWGYAIAAGKVLTILSLFGVMSASALVFNDFLNEIGIGTSFLAILGSVSSGCVSVAALFTNYLTSTFSTRSVGVAAAVLYCFGSFCQIFATNIYPIFISYATHGLAMGVMLPIMFTSFNSYFVERRAFMTAASQIVIGIGNTFAPLCVQYLLEEYGFRGCLAILAAINCNSIIGMLVIQPVEWHMKKVPITDDDVVAVEDDAEHTSTKKIPKEVEQSEGLLATHKEKQMNKSVLSLKRVIDLSDLNSRKGSVISVECFTDSMIITTDKPIRIEKKSSLKNVLDISLLRDPSYLNLMLGIMLFHYGEFGFFAFQPLYLFEINYAQVDVSRVIAVGTAADLVSRLVYTFVTAFVTFPAKLSFFIALILFIAVRHVFFFIDGYWGMIIITAVIGFVMTWSHVPATLIFADYLPVEKYAAGFGLFMFLQGIFSLAMGAVIRYVHVHTGSYVMVFHVLNFLLILCVFTWSIEFILKRCHRRRNKTASTREPIN